METLCVVFFTTTSGHFGQTEIYKRTVENLQKKLGSVEDYCDVDYFANIKAKRDEDKDKAEEIENWLKQKGFATQIRFGEWSHGNQSHCEEYTKDIISSFCHPFVQRSQYALWAEDDFILKGNVDSFMGHSISLLRNNPDVLCVRANHGTDLKDGTYESSSIPTIFHQNKNYTPYGPTFTFQPTIVRSRDVRNAYRLVRDSWHKVKDQHIELTSGQAMGIFSDSNLPFCFIDPKICHSIHIGGPENE